MSVKFPNGDVSITAEELEALLRLFFFAGWNHGRILPDMPLDDSEQEEAFQDSLKKKGLKT